MTVPASQTTKSTPPLQHPPSAPKKYPSSTLVSPSHLLALLLLLDLEQQGAVNVWEHAPERDCGADQRVQLLVAADRELEVARRDALDFEVFGGVAGEFEDFGGEVFEYCRYVHGGCGRERLVEVFVEG